MAVTFVIGNANRMPTSLFSPGTSIASTLANEFGEAADFTLSTLFALGFLLFVITFVVLALAKLSCSSAPNAAKGPGPDSSCDL
jgi:phosphate transport system permease protein